MESQPNDLEILEHMQCILNYYLEIRGMNDLASDLFWDAVVISASDDCQRKGYSKQISMKQTRKEIPCNVPIHVFADPPGYKIGCGGSAMFVLDKLFQIYGNAFHDMKVLFIPAGGYSQRLPNLTALGKLFCPLPFGEKNFQMIDLILAAYLPFLKNMPPGIFLASSDAIISYNLYENDVWTFKNEGFTAIAHPSPVSVGCGHGVYVLPEDTENSNSSCFMSTCLRVLQKPTVQEMHEKGAVVNIKNGDVKCEIIYSDSVFFFDHKIVSKLINFYNKNNPLKCELSSYGDFLQPLGLAASPSYIVKDETNEELALMRSALYRDLYGTNLSILVLKNSHFHHLGSMKEYLHSFCFKNKFSDVFPAYRFSFSALSAIGVIPLYINGSVLHSVVNPMSHIPESTLIEYCDLNIAINIGENCIVSNIQLPGFPVQRFPYAVPNDTLLYTAILKIGFVTIACSIHDDIKKAYEDRYSFEVDFFGKKLENSLAPDLECFSSDCDCFSFWNAKIFPVKDTPKDSLIDTLKIVNCNSEEEMKNLYHNFDEECSKLVSLADILLLKDTEKMIDYQQSLYYKIKSKMMSFSKCDP